MTTSAEWRERRRLLVVQATLQRVRLAYDVHTLRSGLPAASAGPALALGLVAAIVLRRLRSGFALRGLVRAWRAWGRGRR